jgi:hypothetical protein
LFYRSQHLALIHKFHDNIYNITLQLDNILVFLAVVSSNAKTAIFLANHNSNLHWMPTTSAEPDSAHKVYWQMKLTLPVDDPF